MKSEFNLTLKKIIPVSQKKAFEVWLDIEAIKIFMIPAPGTLVTDVKIDARVGGLFSLSMVVGESKIPIHGEYKKIEKYNEIVFSWNSPHVAQNSLIILQFKKISTNETELTLQHLGLENEQEKKAHTSGWQNILEYLLTSCEEKIL